VIGDAPGQRDADALSILLRDRDTALTPPSEAARAVIDTLAVARAAGPGEHPRGRNVFTAWLGERSAAEARHVFVAARISTYDTPDSAVRGFMHRVQYRRNQ
jgi:acetyltransferase